MTPIPNPVVIREFGLRHGQQNVARVLPTAPAAFGSA